MSIPETQLEIWAKPGAGAGSRDTHAAIQTVLERKDAPFAIRKPTIFLQGSYRNDTNVWAESDVDVVVRMDSVFYYDISALTDLEQIEFEAAHRSSEYKLADFKAEVTAWLTDWFGKDAVPRNKAVEIAAVHGRRKADVLICAKDRRYYNAGFMGRQAVEGVRFLAKDGAWITNYPKLHSDNLTAKHQATNGWLKPTIRIFKNMRNRMIDDGQLAAATAPSYFIEGLLYNVPDDRFGTNYETTVVNCFNWIWNAKRAEFHCPYWQHTLLGEASPTSWPPSNCTTFLQATSNLWNDW